MNRCMQALMALALLAPAAHPHTVAADGKDIVDTAVAAGTFKTLAAALTEAGLVDVLKGDGPFTVFAPTDEAFAKLPDGTVESLLKPENRDRLVAILTYHVVPGRISSSAALQAGQAATVQGDELSFRLEAGSLRINESRVLANDIAASNGVIHVIDSVLLPPEPQPQGRKVIGIYTDHPGSRLREQLGLKSSQGYLIQDVVDGSGAEAAGLRPDDVIVTINGKPATAEVLAAAKDKAGVGGYLELLVARRFKVEVSLEH